MAAGSTRRHFADLDGMRGVLAVLVMLYHFGLNTVLNKALPVGQVRWDLCVDFFFALSGFVLCRSVLQTGVGPALFAWRRMGRLLPMHLAIMALFWLVLFPHGFGVPQAISELTGVRALFGLLMANNPAWSMSFELYLPIVLVAGLAGIGRPGPRLSALVMVLAMAAVAWLAWLIFAVRAYPLEPWITWARATAGLTLGFACWLWLAGRAGPEQQDHRPWVFPACACAFLLLILLGTVLPLLAVLLPPVIVATLWVGTHSRSVFSSLPAQWLGRLSFGVYMVHWPVLLAFSAHFGEVALAGNVALKGAMILVTLVLALVLHLLVEMPVMGLFRQWPWARRAAIQA